MYAPDYIAWCLIQHCSFCLAVCVGAAGPDLDHLVPGLARQTHLAVAVAAWFCLGCYVALAGRRAGAGVLTGAGE